MERLWTPALMSQAESRCHRIGQSKEVTATYMDARGTVDEHVAKVLQLKQRLIDKVVDDHCAEDEQMTRETIDEVIQILSGQAA
jgi:SNF2 family DNA or RNA helicase